MGPPSKARRMRKHSLPLMWKSRTLTWITKENSIGYEVIRERIGRTSVEMIHGIMVLTNIADRTLQRMQKTKERRLAIFYMATCHIAQFSVVTSLHPKNSRNLLFECRNGWARCLHLFCLISVNSSVRVAPPSIQLFTFSINHCLDLHQWGKNI